MKKILHLVTGLNTGGAEMMLYKLLSNMDKAEYENIVVSMLDKGTLGDDIEKIGVKVYTLNMKRGIPSIRSVIQLCRIIKRERPHIVQTWLYHADLLGLLAAKICRVKSLIWNIRCSNMDLCRYSMLTKIVLKLLVLFSGKPDAVIVNSTAGRMIHQKAGYKPKEWVEIYNGFEIENFKPIDQQSREIFRNALEVQEDTLLIGMVARYDPMKGHLIFIEAANDLVNHLKVQNLKFLLVGRNVTWKNQEIVDCLDKYKLRDHFLLLGERRDTPSILANLHLYVSASLFGEGFPNVVGEAMCCGTPCVVTDVGDSARVVDQYGRVVRPNDAEGLAYAIKELVEMDYAKRCELGFNARRHIVQNYDIKKIAKDYESLYDKIFLRNSR